MRVKINSFAEPLNIAKERLILEALSQVNIGEYVVFKSGKASDGSPTSGRKAAYWFPDAQVDSGDLIVLYTKKGSSSVKSLPSGRKAHFFYWGREEAQWDANACAVLLYASEWMYLPR